MKAYMTNGTLDFLQKIIETHTGITFYLMTNSSGALAYYEEKKKKIFSSGRTYEILKNEGIMIQEGYIVMQTIPVTDDDQAVFEDRIKNNLLDKMPGLQAFRFLKPEKGNKYVILSQWKSVKDYDKWKQSHRFELAQQILSNKKPAYHGDIPFTTAYFIHQDEENKKS
ncbi:antibiotic biosynthesis monooxygenase family protein [Oceanobacillus halophilus]|uniref:Antibiotic biosynthesis monooxygenase n=1 Tax=Oceanobacillus halophilus TaxID=930130 RepID=A0A494ZX64_9BACI|nr:antibiotic biosynthesis monooxygenase [Oceanobacillus halophilus]RKQ31291.1 antibiotic biosynthesis monooxygenase [Oceanobacillus halophilus]